MEKMKINLNKKGITITSLTIYVIVATIIVAVLVFLNANFFSNINELTNKSKIVGESLNFKTALIHDIKAENDVKVTDYNNNLIRLSNDVKYEIRILDKNVKENRYAVYRNDVQIAKNIVNHTEIDNQKVKEGPFFEYDVMTNTLKVGMKFSDGKNSFVENGNYVVGKEIKISWDNSSNNLLPPIISGDSGDVENPDIPQTERIYAVLYNDGLLQIGNNYVKDSAKTIIRDYGEVSESINLGNPIWKDNKDLIRRVEVLNPVEILNLDFLFAECSELNEIINLNNMKVSQATSAIGTFMGCKNLKSIDLKEWNTSSILNISQMFEGCTNLTRLNLNTLVTNKVTNMSSLLKNCENLKELNINGISTEKVTNMAEMFSGCSSLISLDLNTFNTSLVEDMNNMFSNCTSLISLNISSFNTNKVNNIEKMFYNCRKLASLSINNFSMKNIQNLSYLFYNCMNLTNIDLGNIDTSTVTDMSYMFSNCTKLTNIEFNNFSTENVINLEGMFYNCQAINKIDLTNFNTSKVTNMSQMFAGCINLNEFVKFELLDTSNVENMSKMFKDCSSLKILNLKDTKFTFEKVKDLSMFLSGCDSLYEINLEGQNTQLVENMESMFEDCTSLVDINLTSFDTSKVKKMNKMFMNASKVNKIIVSSKWVSEQAETTDMFTGCGTSVLTKI